MNTGFNPKELHFAKDGREKLIKGITKMSDAVKSTLGPRGNTVLIESNEHLGGITVTKDGVTVAKSVALMDPVENLAVRMMKEAADRTATLAGDGTTTAIVLTEALVKAGTKLMEEDGVSRTEVLRVLNHEAKEISKTLLRKGKKLDKDKLRDVAIISSNNDPEIGGIIAEVYDSVGPDGVVTVERSKTSSTYYETTNGVKVDRGYSSPLFINDQKHDECVLEDTHILVTDSTIENILQIENVLKPIVSERKKLLIIAPCSDNVVNTLAANVMKNGLKLCSIEPPSFGYKQHELMQDIAVSVGATYFSEKTGDDLSLITPDDLGHCAKVIVGRDSTVIVKDDGELSDEVRERLVQLSDAYDVTSVKADREFILSRIASLSGGIGVVYVGGNTDLEQKELYDRVDDAVCAVKSAMEEGILPGGGLTLYNIAKTYANKQGANTKSKQVAYNILSVALMTPMLQILQNAGIDFEKVEKEVSWGFGFDVKREKFGYLMRLGVIDPVKVTRSALENAISVATTILSTNAIITMARTYDHADLS